MLTDADPAFEDIRRVDMVNGVVQPITLADGTVLDGKTPYTLEAIDVVPEEDAVASAAAEQKL